MRIRKLILLFSCAALFFATPAARAEWPKLWPTSSKNDIKESKYQAPAKMAVIWSPAMFNQVGQQSTRGFGGRIYFYNGKNEPIPVEGQLVVYGYKDVPGAPENRAADRKFAFTPQQFTQHYAPTQLGASYSIWVPWDAIGGPQVQVTLIPIFTSATGQLVIGESSHNILPGPTSTVNEVQRGQMTLPPSPLIRPDPNALASPYGVQQASLQQDERGFAPAPGQHYQPAHQQQPQQQPGLSTLSINLPGSLVNQLSAAPPQQIGAMEKLALQRAALATGRPPVIASQPTYQAAPANFANPTAPQAAVPQQGAGLVPPPARFGPPTHQAPAAPNPPPTVGPRLMPPFPEARLSGQPN